MSTLLTTEEVATALRISRRTVEGLRVRGGGPPFIKIGRAVRYSQERVEAYKSANERETTRSADDGRA